MALGTPVVSNDFSDIRMILPLPWQVAATREPSLLAATILRADESRDEIVPLQREWVRTHGTIATAAERLEATLGQYVTQRTNAFVTAARAARS
jgi:hypothetical protein